ncbi:MAG: hypothetical protein ABEK03_10410 [Candidatus Bipolaricaulia bacterium]
MRRSVRVGLVMTALALALGVANIPVLGVTVFTTEDQTYQGKIEAGLPQTLALRDGDSVVRIQRAQITRLSFDDAGVTVATVGEETYQGTLNTELPEALTLATGSATVEIPYSDIAAIAFERPASLLAQFALPLNVGLGLTKRSIPLVAFQDGTRPIPAGAGVWTPAAVWEIPLEQEQTTLSSGPYEVPVKQTRSAVRVTVGLNLGDLRIDASRANLSAWQIAIDYLYYFGHEAALGQPIAIGIFVGEERTFALVQLNPYVSAGLGLATGSVGPPIGNSFATVEAHLGSGVRMNVNVTNVAVHAGVKARFLPISLMSGNGLHGRLNFEAGLIFRF